MTDETAVISHPLPKTVWASLFDPTILRQAIGDSFKKLAPQYQWRNPVMFVVYLGSLLTTALYVQALGGQGEAPAGFILAVTLWLWVTLCSPTSPRASPRAGPRPRRPHCAGRAER